MNLHRTILLWGIMSKSTSSFNILKYSKDRKKKNYIIGSFVGMGVVVAMLVFFGVMIAVGYGVIGMPESVPTLCAVILSLFLFFFSLLKTNAYLFGFKEYEMLTAMPFDVKEIIAGRFLYMYSKSLLWSLTISIAMMIGYGYFARPAFYIYPMWILLTLALQMIAMVLAAIVGAAIVRIGVSFKKTKLVRTILSFAIIIFCFCGRFIVQGIFQSDQEFVILEKTSTAMDTFSTVYFPASLFSRAINQASFLSFIGLIAVAVVIAWIFFRVVAKSYKMINSRLSVGGATGTKARKVSRTAKAGKGAGSQTTSSQAAAGQAKFGKQTKCRSVVSAICYKEFKRLTGSSTYLVNSCVGQVMVLILAVAALFIKGETLVGFVLNDAPIELSSLLPAVPHVVYFLIGMVPITCIALSLEVKNYWILQSMPIRKIDIYRGKMRLNLYITIPFGIFGVLAVGRCLHASWDYMLLYILAIIVFCIFSTTWGMVCGVKHPKMKWENEVEAIKQNMGVLFYMLPNMFLTIIIVCLLVFGGRFVDGRLLLLLAIVIYAIVALIMWRQLKKLSGK